MEPLAPIYGLAFLVQVLFAPIGTPEVDRNEDIKIVGIYHKSRQQCIDAKILLDKTNTNPDLKWGCVEAIHPADEMRLKMQEGSQQHRQEGSH
jgi:hypothetical protein